MSHKRKKNKLEYGIFQRQVNSASGGTNDIVIPGGLGTPGTPNAGIFFLPRAATIGSILDDAGLSVGFTDFVKDACLSCYSKHDQNPTVAKKRQNDSRVAEVIETASLATANASAIVNGARLTWATNGAAADYFMHGLLFAGVSAKQAKVDPGTLAVGNSLNVTGVGFQPDVVFFLANNADSGGVLADANLSFGCAVRGGSQFAQVFSDRDNINPQQNGVGYSNTRAVLRMTNTGTLNRFLEVTGFGSDGFTVTAREAFSGGAWVDDFQYLALKLPGKQVFAGQVTRPTVTGNFDVTSCPFRPRTVLYVTNVNSGVGGSNLSANGNFSVFNENTIYSSLYSVHDVLTQPSDAYTEVSNKPVRVLSHIKNVVESADFVSMLNNGFRLNFTTALSPARLSFYVAFE